MQVSDKHLLPNLMSWKTNPGNAWLAESVEHTALDLQVMRSSPTLGVEITLGRKKKKPTFPCWFSVISLGLFGINSEYVMGWVPGYARPQRSHFAGFLPPHSAPVQVQGLPHLGLPDLRCSPKAHPTLPPPPKSSQAGEKVRQLLQIILQEIPGLLASHTKAQGHHNQAKKSKWSSSLLIIIDTILSFQTQVCKERNFTVL